VLELDAEEALLLPLVLLELVEEEALLLPPVLLELVEEAPALEVVAVVDALVPPMPAPVVAEVVEAPLPVPDVELTVAAPVPVPVDVFSGPPRLTFKPQPIEAPTTSIPASIRIVISSDEGNVSSRRP
jgi:hypothetical protein